MSQENLVTPVTILFDGLGLFCFGNAASGKRECDARFVLEAGHSPSIQIISVTEAGAKVLPHDLDFLGKPITIELESANKPGVTIRSSGEESFQQVLDVEDKGKFHEAVKIVSKDAKLGRKMTITDGEFYTNALTTHQYVRRRKGGSGPGYEKDLGRIADVVGCDIRLEGNGVVVIKEDEVSSLILKHHLPGSVRVLNHIILLTNAPSHAHFSLLPDSPIAQLSADTTDAPEHDHATAGNSDHSHFKFYYGVIEDNADQHLQFELKAKEEKRVRGVYPQNCDWVFLRGHSNLGPDR